MDMTLLLSLIAVAAIAVAVWALFGRKPQDTAADPMAMLAGRLEALAEAQGRGQAELTRTIDARLEAVTKRLGDGLTQHTEQTTGTIKQVHERLAVIDAAQENLKALSSQVTGLQELFSNKQSRGAFGEVQLEDLVRDMLPPSAYEFQVTLSNSKRADCLLKLPNPPGAIVIDAKFPLESYRNLMSAGDEASKSAAERQFRADVLTHIKAIQEKYIVPGETAEGAMMFLPSEAVYAELHTNFQNVIAESHKRRIWIVSPTTAMATLNTVRAVLKDARMREQAGVIQDEVMKLLDDVVRLDERVGSLRKQFSTVDKTLGLVETSTGKVIAKATRIETIQLGDDSPIEDLNPPAPPEPAPLKSPEPEEDAPF